MNPYLYNPAYAGVEGHAVVFFMYRQQWTNLEGAPQVAHASFHVPLKGGIALGAAAFNISQGLLNTSAGKMTVGYLINIDRTHFLRFGMSLGGGINSVNINQFDSPDDPAFNNFLDQNSFLIGDFGVTYHFGHFNIGLSLPNLFSYDVVTQTDFAEVNVTPVDNIFFKMNYRGHLSDDVAFEPHFLYRYSSVGPSQWEGTLIAHLKHIVWVGGSYRQDAGVIALAGAKIKEKVGVGFSYEVGNPNISNELGPTYEINIGYHLGTKKEHAEHTSSFIKSHRLSAEERAKQAELDRQRKIAELQESRGQTAPGDTGDENAILGGVAAGAAGAAALAGDDDKDKSPEQQQTVDDTQAAATTDDPVRQEQDPVVAADPPVESKGDPSLTEDFRTHEELANSDDYVVTRRGNHLLELPEGNFVIAGAFEVFDHAENYSDDLFQQGYYDTIVGYSSARGYYYVVIFQSTNLERVRARRDEFRKRPELSNVWVLQVTE